MENKQEEKKVAMSVEQYNSLLAKIEGLEKTVKGGTTKHKRIKEHTATLREWNGNLVVGNKGAYEKINERTMQSETKIKLLIKKDDKIVEEDVDLLQYLNEGIKVNCKILSQIAHEKESVQGVTHSSPTDESTYRQKGISFSSSEVELLVTSVEYVSKLEVLEGNHVGETLEINNKFLND